MMLLISSTQTSTRLQFQYSGIQTPSLYASEKKISETLRQPRANGKMEIDFANTRCIFGVSSNR